MSMWFVQRLMANLPSHFVVGRQGEDVAVHYLRSLGYKIVGRNVRVGRHKEIDIVARDPYDHVLVFIEVKTRSRESEFVPEMNMTRSKKDALCHAVRQWIARREYEGGYRLDLVCVVEGRIMQHVKEMGWE